MIKFFFIEYEHKFANYYINLTCKYNVDPIMNVEIHSFTISTTSIVKRKLYVFTAKTILNIIKGQYVSLIPLQGIGNFVNSSSLLIVLCSQMW